MSRLVRCLIVVFVGLFSAAAFAQGAVVTRHEISVAGKPLNYVAEAGRIVIRSGEGAVTGHMFFTSYHIPTKGAPRPVTFLWNGGPGANSQTLHLEAFGPKRIAGRAVEDNAVTLLTDSDLVFVDPIGTGFSRAVNAQSAADFYSTLGDFAAMTQFVRNWLAQNHARNAPVFLIGESFGVWRAAAVAQELEEQGQPVAGIVLISGGAGVGTGPLPRNLVTALRTPNRTATALFHGRLATDLGTDRDAAVTAATAWAKTVYAPVLAHIDTLSGAERDKIAADLAHYTGLKPDQIDRKALVVSPRAYLGALLKDKGEKLDTFDMRLTREPAVDGASIDAYLRHDLNYRTGLAYAGLGTTQTADASAPAPGWINEHWSYNSAPITAAAMAAAMAGEGPPGSLPWALNAMRINPKLRILVAAGLYDSLNSCAANDALHARLDPSVADNFTMKCYLGGHMMYRDAAARRKLSADIKAFVSAASR